MEPVPICSRSRGGGGGGGGVGSPAAAQSPAAVRVLVVPDRGGRGHGGHALHIDASEWGNEMAFVNTVRDAGTRP